MIAYVFYGIEVRTTQWTLYNINLMSLKEFLDRLSNIWASFVMHKEKLSPTFSAISRMYGLIILFTCLSLIRYLLFLQ